MIIKPPLPDAFVIFCDDVRQEVGNKASIIGTYGPEITIQGTPPLSLPQLCASVWIRCDPANLPEKMTFRLLRSVPELEDEQLFEAKLPIPKEARQLALSLGAGSDGEPRFIEIKFSPRLVGVPFASPCRIKARLYIEEDEYLLGSLDVKFVAPE